MPSTETPSRGSVWRARVSKRMRRFRSTWSWGEERSIRAVAKQLNKSTTLIGRWSRTYQWVGADRRIRR